MVAAIVPIAAAFHTHHVDAKCHTINVSAAYIATFIVSRNEPLNIELNLSSGTRANNTHNPAHGYGNQLRLRSRADSSESDRALPTVLLSENHILLCFVCTTILALGKIENLTLQ